MILLADRSPPDAVEEGVDERLELLYRLHSRPIFAYLLRHTLGDSRQAEDVMQETFVRAWRHLQRHCVEIESFRPWLYTVSRRLVIDRLRERAARPAETILSDVTRLPTADDPTEKLVVQETVRRALMALRPDHRAVLIDVYYRGLSGTEVAEIRGIPVGTVKSRTYYALRALREVIAVEGLGNRQ
jgi:RNA polymerase sigma-70 factor, ECF subfamily